MITTSISNACKLTDLGQTTIYAAIRAGKLKATKVGRRTLINVESLRAFVGGEA